MTMNAETPLFTGLFTEDGLDQIVTSPEDARRETKDLRAMGCEVNRYTATDESTLYAIDDWIRDGVSFGVARNRVEAGQFHPDTLAAEAPEAAHEAAQCGATPAEAEAAAEAAQLRTEAALLQEQILNTGGHGKRARLMERKAAALAEAEAIEGRPWAETLRLRLEAVEAAQRAPEAPEAPEAPMAELVAGCPLCGAVGVTEGHAEGCPMAARMAEIRAAKDWPSVGQLLPNGAKVWAVIHGRDGWAYVVAETLGRAGHPFATWAIEADSWATHWGHYLSDYESALLDALERAGKAAPGPRSLSAAAVSGGRPMRALWAASVDRVAEAIEDSIDLYFDWRDPAESVRYGVGLPEGRECLGWAPAGGRAYLTPAGADWLAEDPDERGAELLAAFGSRA